MTLTTSVIVVNILASITALYMCFSPGPAIYKIHKRRATGHMPALPLVAQWTYNHIWMLYGYLTNAYFPLFTTYAVGNALSIIFLSVYYISANDQKWYVLRLSLAAFLFNAGATLYTLYGSSEQNENEVAYVIGMMAIAVGVVLYASPLATITTVLRTKSASSIPITMVIMGAISNAVWCIYGLLVHDVIIIAPTIANTLLCIFQLILYITFKPTHRHTAAVEVQEFPRETSSPRESIELSAADIGGGEPSFYSIETPMCGGGSQPPVSVTNVV